MHQRHRTFLFTFLLLGAAPRPGPGHEPVRGPRGEGGAPGGVPEPGEGSPQHRGLVSALGRGPKIGEGSQNEGEFPAPRRGPCSGKGSQLWGRVPVVGRGPGPRARGGSGGSLSDPRPSGLLSRHLLRCPRTPPALWGRDGSHERSHPGVLGGPRDPDTRSVPKIPFIPEIPSVPAPVELRARGN